MNEIPRINIHKVQINEIPIWKTNVPIFNNISKPIVDIPACVRVHRNNLQVLLIVIKMNTAHIQNVVISVFLVLNLCNITPTNLSTHNQKPPQIKSKNLSNLQ